MVRKLILCGLLGIVGLAGVAAGANQIFLILLGGLAVLGLVARRS